LPETVRALFLGNSPALTALADTRHFLLWALTATLALGLVFLLLIPRLNPAIPGVLILIAAASFFGGYERLREGARKPFLIHDHMFSNGVRVDEIAALNETGILSKARWAARTPPDDPVDLGRQVFRAQCASCHTIDGYQGILELLPDDPDITFAVLFTLYEQGEAFIALERGQTVDKSALDYPFMPPFVGTEEELEALAAYLGKLASDGPTLARAGATP
jgi:mono/diheme cytochrome c family protein